MENIVLVLCTLCFLVTNNALGKLTLVPEYEQIIRFQGEAHTVACISDTITRQVIWKTPRGKVIDANCHVTRRSDIREESLTLIDLQRKDEGNYTCEEKIYGNITDVQWFELRVYEPISFHNAETIVATEGTDVTLTCNATSYPNPQVRWIFDKFLVPENVITHNK